MRALIDAIRESTVMANVPTLPVPLGEPIPRYPLVMTPEKAKKSRKRKSKKR